MSKPAPGFKTLVTTIRRAEVGLVDELVTKPYGRAGVLRAALRFALEHRAEFEAWLKADEASTEFPDAPVLTASELR